MNQFYDSQYSDGQLLYKDIGPILKSTRSVFTSNAGTELGVISRANKLGLMESKLKTSEENKENRKSENMAVTPREFYNKKKFLS